MLTRILIGGVIGILLLLVLFPDIRTYILRSTEGFVGTGIRDSGFNRRVAFETRQVLERVGKEPLPRQPMFTDDPRMGNARRDLSRMPSTEGSGFSLPEAYTHYQVPDFRDGYDIAIMNAPRAAETYHAPRSDAFHLYYQTLHNTLDNTHPDGYIVAGAAPLP